MTGAENWSPEQLERYSRQILVPDIGGRGQRQLLASRVVVNGTSTLAEACAVALLRCGIGYLHGAPNLVARVAGKASIDNHVYPLEAFADPNFCFDSLPALPDLVVDTELPPAAWHTLARAAGDANVPLLFVRATASVAIVALRKGTPADSGCPAWFFDYLPRNSPPHFSFDTFAACQWAASWASALAIRALVNRDFREQSTSLQLYDVASGEITEVYSARGHSCEFCTPK